MAGPCLAASLKQGRTNYCVVLLCCGSIEASWGEGPKLVQWGLAKRQKLMNSCLSAKLKCQLLKNFIYI